MSPCYTFTDIKDNGKAFVFGGVNSSKYEEMFKEVDISVPGKYPVKISDRFS